MLRLVLDTNILIAALIRKNTAPYQLYRAWSGGVFDLVTSQEQLDELARVLNYPKFQKYFTPEEAQDMLTGVSTYSIRVTNLPSVSYSMDAADNLILATAIAAKADYIVSGDKKHLLVLEMVEAIPIITAQRAVKLPELSE